MLLRPMCRGGCPGPVSAERAVRGLPVLPSSRGGTGCLPRPVDLVSSGRNFGADAGLVWRFLGGCIAEWVWRATRCHRAGLGAPSRVKLELAVRISIGCPGRKRGPGMVARLSQRRAALVGCFRFSDSPHSPPQRRAPGIALEEQLTEVKSLYARSAFRRWSRRQNGLTERESARKVPEDIPVSQVWFRDSSQVPQPRHAPSAG